MLAFLPCCRRRFSVKRCLPVCFARVDVVRGVEARRVQPVKDGRSQTFVFVYDVILSIGLMGILRFGRRRHDSGKFQFANCFLVLVREDLTA